VCSSDLNAASKGVVVQIILLDCWHNKAWLVETDPTMTWGLKYLPRDILLVHINN
jgi:hypothetical protein